MARAIPGLNLRQAALLLRCHQLREARERAETARLAAEHAAACEQLQAAQNVASLHATEATALLRRGYDELVGRGTGMSAIDGLRAREVTSRDRQTQLAEVATAAQETVAEAAARERQAKQRLADAARAVARRDHLLEAASRDAARIRAARHEVRAEDADAALRAWRG